MQGLHKGDSNVWTQRMQYAVDTVHSGHSTQWMQWNSGIWWWGHCLWCKKVKPVDAVWGTLSLVLKGQTSGCSTQWKQYTVDTVCSGCSTQWIQWNSVIWWWGTLSLVQKGQTSGYSMQWTQYAVDAVCSGCSMQWTQ